MSKLEWTTLDLKHAEKVKIIGDNGPIKIIIGGPRPEDGLYWWHVKVEEKGFATNIEEAKKMALETVKLELEEAE
jgi:hypothetical protein